MKLNMNVEIVTKPCEYKQYTYRRRVFGRLEEMTGDSVTIRHTIVDWEFNRKRGEWQGHHVERLETIPFSLIGHCQVFE